ncbi:MAG TPA: DMT family transporter, partial [Patescibacteria group bacterium]|nr:DMT family transporter [Patescibacteria group bacterium]
TRSSGAWHRAGALTAIILWGLSFVATKAALREISPITLIFTRFAIGSALLVSLLAVRRQPLAPPRDTWASLALMGFVGVFVHQVVQSYGLTMTTAVRTGWLIGLTPIWSAVLSAMILKERFGPGKLAGLGLGFVGAALVVTRADLSGGLLSLPSTRGDLLILASTMNWAFYSTLGHPTIRRLGSARATAGAMVAGTSMLAGLFAWRAGWNEYAALSATGWGAVLFLGIGCSGLAYMFWYGALEKMEATRVASFLYLEPLVTLAAGVTLLGETVGPATIIGGLVVLAGVYLVQREGARQS